MEKNWNSNNTEEMSIVGVMENKKGNNDAYWPQTFEWLYIVDS